MERRQRAHTATTRLRGADAHTENSDCRTLVRELETTVYTKRHTGARLFCSRIGYPTTTILFFRMFTSLLGFTAVIDISHAHEDCIHKTTDWVLLHVLLVARLRRTAYSVHKTPHWGRRLFCSRIGYPTTTILFFRMFTSLLGFTAVIEISPAHLPVACTRRLHTQNNKLVQLVALLIVLRGRVRPPRVSRSRWSEDPS